MSRFKRSYYQNAVYHVVFRGNNKEMILKHKSDKLDLLVSLKKFQERKKFKIYGFVLMDNHVHMIIETSEVHNVSKVMQAVLLSYSIKYRRRYGYEGHVWQGRFYGKPVAQEDYIWRCLRYIHDNPVKANIVSDPCDYMYSSARFYAGLRSKGVYDYLDLTKYGDTSVITHDVAKGYLETVHVGIST